MYGGCFMFVGGARAWSAGPGYPLNGRCGRQAPALQAQDAPTNLKRSLTYAEQSAALSERRAPRSHR